MTRAGNGAAEGLGVRETRVRDSRKYRPIESILAGAATVRER